MMIIISAGLYSCVVEDNSFFLFPGGYLYMYISARPVSGGGVASLSIEDI